MAPESSFFQPMPRRSSFKGVIAACAISMPADRRRMQDARRKQALDKRVLPTGTGPAERRRRERLGL